MEVIFTCAEANMLMQAGLLPNSMGNPSRAEIRKAARIHKQKGSPYRAYHWWCSYYLTLSASAMRQLGREMLKALPPCAPKWLSDFASASPLAVRLHGLQSCQVAGCASGATSS